MTTWRLDLERLHWSTEHIFSIPGYLKRGPGLVAALACFVVAPTPEARAEYAPRVAIVMCEDTQVHDWYQAHSSSHALVGLAGLVGVPYRTLTLAEYLAEPNPDDTSVWFADCSYIEDERVSLLSIRLQEHLGAGGSVFLSSPLGIFYAMPDGNVDYRPMEQWFSYLGVVDEGWYPMLGYRIQTTASDHAMAASAGYPVWSPLTQGLESGVETLSLVADTAGEVLLEIVSSDGMESYPYLIVTEPVAGAGTGGGRGNGKGNGGRADNARGTGARVVAIGSYGTYPGPATPFRNPEPAGYYDNQLLPYLIHALLWLVGPENQPFAGVQLSHAPMTAIGRLDGDWSDEAWSTRLTLEYLIDIGEHTGLAVVYGIVSSFAEDDDWDVLRQLGPELERLGGSIGSHSHQHDFNMSDLPDESSWLREVAQSLQQIRDELDRRGYAPAASSFINPGNTIKSSDYRKFFRDIELYMTHGFETTPYASGVMGFGLPSGIEPRPVINNTPVPDYQWLYHTGWVYTVEQAAGFQALLLDYYQHTVGRGVLYNQMWHDYAIAGSPPRYFPDTESTLPLFETHRDHFATERVYMPAVDELVGKMHIAHGIGIASTGTDQELVVTLDYSAIQTIHRAHAAGMGVRVNGSSRPVHSVQVDGQDYHAFTADTVILPPLRGVRQTLFIQLGAAESEPESPRLTFISKSFQAISGQQDSLDIELRDPEQFTRFCVAGPRSTVILHASSYRRDPGGELCGHRVHGFAAPSISARVLDMSAHDLAIVAADRVITAASYQDHVVSFELAAGDEGSLTVDTAEDAEVLVDGEPGQVMAATTGFELTIPRSSESVQVSIRLTDPCLGHDSNVAGDCSDRTAGCGCAVGSRRDGGGLALLCLATMLGVALRRRRRAR